MNIKSYASRYAKLGGMGHGIVAGSLIRFKHPQPSQEGVWLVTRVEPGPLGRDDWITLSGEMNDVNIAHCSFPAHRLELVAV